MRKIKRIETALADERALVKEVSDLLYIAEDTLRACVAEEEWWPAKFYMDHTHPALTGKEQE